MKPYLQYVSKWILVFTTIASPLLSQNKNYNFQHLSVDEGLKNSRAVSVVQDADGYVWFATHTGMDRFSGSDISHYSMQNEHQAYANNDIINVCIASPYHTLLCGTKNGKLYRYNKQMDYFESMLREPNDGALANIFCLLEEKNGSIWIGTTSGLMYYNYRKNRCTIIRPLGFNIQSLAKRSKEELWIGSTTGLKLLHIPTQQCIAIRYSRPQLKAVLQGEITFLKQISETRLMIGTRSSDLMLLEYRNKELSVIKQIKFGSPTLHAPVNKVVTNPDGNYTVALDGKGIFIMDTSFCELAHYTFDKNDEHSLSSNGVYDLLYSVDGICWVATYGGGINYANPNKKPFEVIKHVPYVSNSLRNNTVSALNVDPQNRVWAGTKEGLSIFTPRENTWRHIPDLSSEIKEHLLVLDICNGSDHDVWVATYGNGLFRINTQSWKIEKYSKQGKGGFQTQTNYLYGLIKDQQKRIWSGGIWGGITVLDVQKGLSHAIDVTNVRSFCETQTDMLVGTLFGLQLVNKEDFTIKSSHHALLNSSRIMSITQVPHENAYYLGTDANGLLYWDRDADTLSQYQVMDGLPSNSIRNLMYDDMSRLWISSTEGLSVFNASENTFENYNISDGIASNEFSENAGILHPNGNFYLGGPKGITVFNPHQITKSTQKVQAILTGLKLLGENLEINETGPLVQHINLQDGITLAHYQNSLSMLFGAIAFTSPDQIQYKWRMKGLENHWNGPSKVREANYAQLPPGKYTFEVMVSNDDGIWNNPIKHFSIRIKNPFWATAWAYIVYLLLLIGLVYLLLKYYNAILHEKHSLEKQQFFISIAHDLRTPLSLIKLPIDKMVNQQGVDAMDKNKLFNVKRNLDRLTNLVNQLLDFQKADLKKMQLQVDAYDLVVFMQDRLAAFAPLAKEKEIIVETVVPNHPPLIWFDKNKMEKIAYNLLSNAFKYTPRKGQVHVTIQYNTKYCILKIKDSGEGIPAQQQKNIFQRYYRASNAINSQEVGSGVGLMLTKQLVELHKGKISFESEWGRGTEFNVAFRMGREHFSENDFRRQQHENVTQTPSVYSEKKEVENRSDGPKLLIVEDNIELLDALAEELHDTYHIFKANNGAEGLKQVKAHMPHIIISDVMMPVMNGHELCSKLKSEIETCHIPVVLLTALDSPEYKREGLEHGADAYLDKPVEVKLLRVQLENLLKNRAALKKKFLLPASLMSDVSPTNADEELLDKVNKYVLNNLNNNALSVESTAIEIGVSRPVLYRKIKSLTDLSPQQFLLTIKLKEAIRLMKEERKNISEAAYEVGFSDPKYFSQTFKKHFGITPSQYLKSGTKPIGSSESDGVS